jgi:peptidoglycan/xylan/chitin deacetylase (PgdA/CDA1 family)
MQIEQLNRPLKSKSEGHTLRGAGLQLRRILSFGKKLFQAIYLYCGYVELRDLVMGSRGKARAVIIYYHRIGGRDVLTKPAAEFRRDLIYLRRKYECITLSELCQRLRRGTPLRRRTAVVTFDDGYRDNYTVAMPVLQEVGVPATFFVSTGFIGAERGFPHDEEVDEGLQGTLNKERQRYLNLTWDDLRAMEEAGFEIGSHTVNHANLGSADQQTITRELEESLSILNRELGERPRAFAFPWGKPENISVSAFESVARAGYYTAVSAYGGSNTRGSNPLHLQRMDAGNGRMSWLALRARIAGFDPDYLALKLNGKAAAVRNAFAESIKSSHRQTVTKLSVPSEVHETRAVAEKVSRTAA